METLLKHKGFIEMVARDLIRPDESQQAVKDVLEAYSKIDSTAEVLVGCSTCENKFKDTFKIILAYINQGLVSESDKKVIEPFISLKESKKKK